jgi:hypothetical protein
MPTTDAPCQLNQFHSAPPQKYGNCSGCGRGSGYIVDYRDLFNSLETAITDYTSGALDGYEKQRARRAAWVISAYWRCTSARARE